MVPDLRLLLVEDSPEDERVLLHLLRAGGLGVECHRVDDEAGLVRALGAPWDLVISDYFLPQMTGDRVLELVRERWPQTSVIILSGRVGEDLAVELIRRGASDFILKDNLPRVPFAVERVLQESRVRAARQKAEAQVVRLGRMYRILSETNQAIVRISDPRELLQEICRLAASSGSFDRVRVTQNQNTVLVTAAEAGDGDSPPLFWERHVLDGGRSLVNNDLGQGADSRFGNWASAALFPLKVSGKVWGCLGFYSQRKDAFPPEEATLLHELAEDLGFGLQARTQDQSRRETEQLLSDMATLVPGVFYKLSYHSREGARFLYASPGIDLLLPLSPRQIQEDAGKVFRALAPGDRRKFYKAAIRSRTFLTVFNQEFRLVRPNGTFVWVLATAFPQNQTDGSVVWTGLAIDVSPQYRLQEALQREQELLSVILDNIGDGIVAVDEDGNLIWVNQTAARLLGRSPDWEAQGPWANLDPDLPWEARDRFQPWFRKQTDGSVLHLEALASDLTNPGQGSRGRVMVLRDMTDRDRVENRLRQSEKLESIGLLAGGIAHDFNNLLTGVFGFIQLARMNCDQREQVARYLDLALGPFQRARTLTQQLLSFAKGNESTKESLALPQVLPAILQFTLSGSPVVWDLEGGTDPWPVVANEAQLHQVFENLFLNAKQAMASGGTLSVGLQNVPAPGPEGRDLPGGPYLEVTVQDSGPGISPEHISKIFDPFFTTKSTGTGLGLSICFSVMKKHGGTIEVESVPGKGTCFRLFWPAIPTLPGESEG